MRRAAGRYLQQPEGAEALEGQRRDALQGVVAEDPAEEKEVTRHHEHHSVLPPSHPLLPQMSAPAQTAASPRRRGETLTSPATPVFGVP